MRKGEPRWKKGEGLSKDNRKMVIEEIGRNVKEEE